MPNNATLDKLREQTADGCLEGDFKVPANALRFGAGPFAFAAGEAKDGKVPISLRARSGQPIEHWYWGKVVHDMAGFKAAKPTLPIDYCHYTDEVLGFLNEFKASDEGLDASGELVTFKEDDRATEIIHKARAGVPYEASIYFDPNSMVLEEVGPSAKVKVNGYELQGPAIVVRQWALRGVAVCPYGADGNTNTKLADALFTGDVPVNFVSTEREAPMDKANATAPTNPPANNATELAAAAAAQNGGDVGKTATDPRAEFKATLEKFTAKFGAENGSKWAAEGLTYEAALEKHTAELASQLATAGTQIGELKTKLGAVPRGEAEALSAEPAEKHPAGDKSQTPAKFAHMGGIGKFAGSIKVPGRK